MNNAVKILIVVGLLAVIGIVLAAKQQPAQTQMVADATTPVVDPQPTPSTPSSPTAQNLPRLVDLGAKSCIPCKQMAPILDGLRDEYAGRMKVEFIDVWQNPEAGKAYGIRLIPTQIFFDATGKEQARHEGFMSKADILAQWSALGIEFPSNLASTQN